MDGNIVIYERHFLKLVLAKLLYDHAPLILKCSVIQAIHVAIPLFIIALFTHDRRFHYAAIIFGSASVILTGFDYARCVNRV